MYGNQHCFICRPSDSNVSEDAGIEPRTVATTALAVSRSDHAALSHPQRGYISSTRGYISSTTRLCLIHTRLYLIHMRLYIIHTRGYISSTTRLYLIHNESISHPHPVNLLVSVVMSCPNFTHYLFSCIKLSNDIHTMF